MPNHSLSTMPIRRNLNLILLAGAGLSLLAAPSYADGYAPRVGEPHPEFTLPDIADGTPVSLSQFRGRKVLLIHLASW